MASTAMLGALLLAGRRVGHWGLVTEMPELQSLPLLDFEQMIFGGWDVTSTSILERLESLAGEDRALSSRLLAEVRGGLARIDRRIRPGFLGQGSPGGPLMSEFGRRLGSESLGESLERLGGDLDSFRKKHGVETVVVINVSSTEAPIAPQADHQSRQALALAIRRNRRAVLTPGILYAFAALERGLPYVNFTPSLETNLPALHELAKETHAPFYGKDGKSGETLVKTVLAPLFRFRNLEVLSWEGFNILGGGDGRVLNEAKPKSSKVKSKSGVLPAALGYEPHAGVFIEYVPSLGNWKTAWDFIHFRGFLGTKMSLQFTWQGCDSILAAPLVLDLARLAEFAARCKESGAMSHLACFFKDPMGCQVQALSEQFRLLRDYVAQHTEERAAVAGRAKRRKASRPS